VAAVLAPSVANVKLRLHRSRFTLRQEIVHLFGPGYGSARAVRTGCAGGERSAGAPSVRRAESPLGAGGSSARCLGRC